MTTSTTNEYTYLYKSLTLYFRKGDVCCVREMSWDKDGLLYWPKFLDHSSTSFASWLGLLNRGSLRAAKPSVCKLVLHAGILSPTDSNRLGTWLYYYLTATCFRCSSFIYTGASLDWRLGWGSIYNTRTLVEGVLFLCRDAVSVFYNPNRQGHQDGRVIKGVRSKV